MFFWLLLVQTLNSSTLLKNLCDSDNPNTKTFTRLTQILQGHYEPAPIVIAERHKFWTASQEESESVSEFVVRLKKLASICSFSEFLSQALRDRLVSGLDSKMSRTQRHLLSIRDLICAVAHDKCVADEMAGKANIEHMGESASGEVNKVQDFSSFRGRNNTSGQAKRRVVKTQTNASHVEVCSIVWDHANSEMPRVITVSGKVIFVRCVKPHCRKCS